MLVIFKFAGIHEDAVTATGFIPNMGLFPVRFPFHGLTTPRAIYYADTIVLAPLGRVPGIEHLTTGYALEPLRLVIIKPQPFAIGTAIDRDILIRNPFHTVLAFRAL